MFFHFFKSAVLMIFQQYTTDMTQNEYDIDRHCSNSTISVGVVLKCHQKSTFQKSYWEIKKLEFIFWSQKFSYAESKYQIYRILIDAAFYSSFILENYKSKDFFQNILRKHHVINVL